MLVFSLFISAICAVLLAWAGGMFFETAFAPVFSVSLLAVFLPSARAMLNFPTKNEGREGDLDAIQFAKSGETLETVNPLQKENGSSRFLRVLLRGVLIGLLAVTTVWVVVVVHISSRLGFQSLYLIIERGAIIEDALISVPLALVFGFFMAVILDAVNGWSFK